MRRLRLAVIFWTVCTLACPTYAGADSRIADRLLSNGYAPQYISLTPTEKAQAITELNRALPSLTGKRHQRAAFWLASLGPDYGKYRDYLVATLCDCGNTGTECDEDTAGLIIALYNQGHHDVLHALLLTGLKSDGALSEQLGTFYEHLLLTSTSDFIQKLATINKKNRDAVCRLAGAGDGSGIPGRELVQIKSRLRRTGSLKATQCLREVEESNSATGAADQK